MTYQDLISFVNVARAWLERDQSTDTKLVYAVRRVLDRAKPIINDYQAQAADLEIEFATEKDGVLLRAQNGSLEYSKADLKKRNDALRALANTSVSIQPHIVARVPENLPFNIVDAFTGFVLPALDEQEPES